VSFITQQIVDTCGVHHTWSDL